VHQGEVLGIIGRNGAGKSTLLKILSRITEPTAGRVTLRGRVASLLEVGTGFHPELTGRENIYLNGAILGMTRAEIRKKFDEIVAFAETEKFLDTPVKYYSSGMYVRLAFAVAAHLEPEILIVDEVLAVGDVQFQKKCLGKMSAVAREGGRTVLFVSHNMAAVSGLCGSAIWLSDGSLIEQGVARTIVKRYLSNVSSASAEARFVRRNQGEDVRVERVQLIVDDSPATTIQAGQSCIIRVYYRRLNTRSTGPLSLSIMLFSDGQKLVNLWTNYHSDFGNDSPPTPSHGYVDCRITKWPFRTHKMRLDIYIHTGNLAQDWVEEAMFFDSCDGDYYGSGAITNPDQGILFLDHSWNFYADEQLVTPADGDSFCVGH
jgi:lipopolysaccharide transport system ATP-binding protein